MKKNISQLFDEFLFECEFSRKLRPETLKGYRAIFATFIKFNPDVSLNTLSSTSVVNFFKILEQRKRIVGKGSVRSGVKKSTIAKYWNKLNCFFDWLLANGHLSRNPFQGMSYPTPTYEDKKFLRKAEIEKILTAILTHSGNSFTLKRNLVIFYLLLFCGLRKEELLQLQVRDIDFEKRILTIRAETSKTPRTRYLPLHSQLLLHLKDYYKERKHLTTPFLVASSVRDNKLSSEGLKHIVASLKVNSGVPFHLHQFRHTFAVNYLKSSNNVAKLKQLLGHKNISMTLLYLRCLPTNEMRSDIENMSIDSLF